MPALEPAFVLLLVCAAVSAIGCAWSWRAYRRRVRKLKRELREMEQRSKETVQTILDGKQRIEAILRGMFEGVIVVEPDGKVLFINDVFADLFDVRPAAAIGKNYWEVFRQERIHALIVQALESRAGVRGECSVIGALEERHFEVQISAVRGDGGFLGAAVILHDVTTIRQLEKMRSEFVANVSHELKTPLSSIIGAADTLKGGAMNDVEHRDGFVEMIRRHADDLKKLIDDLLDLAKIESTGTKIDKQPSAVAEIFEDLRRRFEQDASAKMIALVFSASDGEMASCSRTKIRQALANLIENALKYTDAGGRVAVEAASSGEWTTFSVADSGIGISEEDQNRVFERFYRTEKSRSRDAGGTGLGLSIVKHVAESHGGFVELESRPGSGSTFRVRIPRA